ncbi:DUF362 domain-containing protein [Candidatus Woesearchaeota archaeon]|nr:DUF362 domain-containing protein [Candidatus Woesearchaeota archaeon]
MPLKPKAGVALVKGAVRYDNILKSFEMVADSISDELSNSMRIVIKPDFFFQKRGTSTSVDAMKAVLDFILDFTNKKITVAEGLPTGSDSRPVFHQAGFHELADDYGLRFVDLNKDDYVTIAVSKTLRLRVAKTILNSDFIVSVAVPKLAGSRFSGAVANAAVGSVLRTGKSAATDDKRKLISSKNYDAAVAELTKVAKPSLAVVDGFYSVVGNRTPETFFCVASADAVAADVVVAAALGKELNRKIPKQEYLGMCSRAGLGQLSLAKIKVFGEKL